MAGTVIQNQSRGTPRLGFTLAKHSERSGRWTRRPAFLEVTPLIFILGVTVVITNTTGWQSATRLRKPAIQGKGNQGILEDRLRGSGGIRLGGTIKERIEIFVPYDE